MHCHQVREALNADLRRHGKWSRELYWRYPLPENVGLELEVGRGNIVKKVAGKSPAAQAGIQSGDVVKKLNGVPIHSFADAQFALDIAPKKGTVEVVWQRGEKVLKDNLALADGWRKTDLTWRPSMRWLVPAVRMSGDDLKAEEKQKLGLTAKQLAFRLTAPFSSAARVAGIRADDVILGVDGRRLDTNAEGFRLYVRRNYFVGDRMTVNLLRDGKPMAFTLTLGR
jgi:S1-C subfamily serine protease